jgi:hypothetical protein
MKKQVARSVEYHELVKNDWRISSCNCEGMENDERALEQVECNKR